MNKKGIEISINFVIMLILALAVFFGGLAIAKNFFGKASSLGQELNTKTQSEIISLLDDGSPLAVPIQRIEIDRNKYATTGVGVYNVLGKPANFTVEITPVDNDCGEGVSVIDFSKRQTIELKNTEKHVFRATFYASSDAKACKYMFNVIVNAVYPNGTSLQYPPYKGNVPKIIVVLD